MSIYTFMSFALVAIDISAIASVVWFDMKLSKLSKEILNKNRSAKEILERPREALLDDYERYKSEKYLSEALIIVLIILFMAAPIIYAPAFDFILKKVLYGSLPFMR